MSDIKYKKLLAEVLGRVDEEINITLDLDRNNNIDINKLDQALGVKGKRSNKIKASPYRAAAKDLANNSGNTSAIEDGDFEAHDKIQQEPSTINLLKLLASDSSNPDIKDASTDSLNYVPDELKSKAAAAIGAEDEFDDLGQTPISSVKSAARFKTDATGTADFDKIEEFKVTVPQEMMDRFNQIKSPNGEGLIHKFSELTKFGNAVKGGKAGIEAWQKEKQAELNISPEQSQLLFMTYAPVFSTFADMGKVLGGNEAGYALEKYLAVLLSAPILGGANGAVDNANQIIKSSGKNVKVYMSAKFYQGASIKSISQSIGKPKKDGGQGIQAVVKDDGNDVFYISLAKVEDLGKKVPFQKKSAYRSQGEKFQDVSGSKTDGSYNGLVVFLTKVSWDGEKYVGTMYKADGTVALTYECKYNEETLYILPQTETAGSLVNRLTLGGFLIPTPTIKADTAADLVSTTASAISGIADKLQQQLVTAVKDIYLNLEKTGARTKSYTAVRSGAGVDKAVEYINDIGYSYKTVFDQFKALFSKMGDLSATGIKQNKGDVFRKDIKENKTMNIEEIAKLTRAILKEMIDNE